MGFGWGLQILWGLGLGGDFGGGWGGVEIFPLVHLRNGLAIRTSNMY